MPSTQRRLEPLYYYLRLPLVWSLLVLHNSWGILNVFFITWLRPMKGGAVGPAHPFASAIDPDSGKCIWHQNILYCSTTPEGNGDSDAAIIDQVGSHMLKMFNRCVATDTDACGVTDRMPPSINYIHGCVHYNGAYIILNDIRDGYRHFSDKRFRQALWRFILHEGREPVLILRDRNYDRQQLNEFVCYLRCTFPYFANSNGNRRRVGWGNPSPYPTINIITGHWKRFIFSLYHRGEHAHICLPPMTQRYFLETHYSGNRSGPYWIERMLARLTEVRVNARGERGNLFFVDRRKLKAGFRFDPARPQRLGQRLLEKAFGKPHD